MKHFEGTTSFPRSLFPRTLFPRTCGYPDHSIELYTFPYLNTFPDQFILACYWNKIPIPVVRFLLFSAGRGTCLPIELVGECVGRGMCIRGNNVRGNDDRGKDVVPLLTPMMSFVIVSKQVKWLKSVK